MAWTRAGTPNIGVRPRANLGPIVLSLLALVVCPMAACQMNDEPRTEPVQVGATAISVGNTPYVSAQNVSGSFKLAGAGQPAPMVVASDDHAGVVRAARTLQADIHRVTGAEPQLSVTGEMPSASEVVLVGTLGRSSLIDGLVSAGKLDPAVIAGKWETFLIQSVDAPTSGVSRGLVIAGSDKRGTIYGIYDLAAQIGVSPWYWWADVPVARQTDLYVLPGPHSLGPPTVKYRGIFINDENPSLLAWYNMTYSAGDGRFGHAFYERVFELMQRLKANYLWPAMWGRSFNADDPDNPRLADEYGIVMGTSHHEPMMRAQQEWKDNGTGDWNYETNAAALRSFWEGGIQRMGGYESYLTIGMRGDGDVAMGETANIALLQQIMTDQRQILQQVTGKNPSSIPQVWTLYKEVQDYFELGMQVPDDVTLIFTDDNWGNLKRLPGTSDAERAGGYGAYYHFDYVGDPRSYKWLNANAIPRIWEQMHLAQSHGVDRIWLVNVGDIKPMELPTQFFLDYAWTPDAWPAERVADYPKLWAEQQFGATNAAAVGDILKRYAKYNSRRKPELLAPDTYSLVNYREAEQVVADYSALASQAQKIYDGLADAYKDAFDELVLYPVQACSNLNELYVTAGRNQLYARQKRAATNDLAARVDALFQNDATYTQRYHGLAGGKWNHMMDQTHIGYTTWEQPEQNIKPTVAQITLPADPAMGVAIEGSTSAWPAETADAILDELTPYYPKADRYLEVYNLGQGSFGFTVSPGAPYVVATPASGTCQTEQRVLVSVDWTQAPIGKNSVPITVAGPNGSSVVVQAVINNPESPRPEDVLGFVETAGYVSMEAEHFTRKAESNGITWQKIPDLGRTLSGMTPFPVTAASQIPGGEAPHLEYRMHLFTTGKVKVRTYLSPTLNFHKTGLRYAVAFDDAQPETVDMHREMPDEFDEKNAFWQAAVSNNTITMVSTHDIAQPGTHVLKFWMIDAGVVLEKLVVETGTVKPSYLGPPAMAPLNGTPTDAGGSGGSSNQPGTSEGGRSSGGSATPPGGEQGCGCSLPGKSASTSRTAWPLVLVLIGITRRRRARRRQEA